MTKTAAVVAEVMGDLRSMVAQFDDLPSAVRLRHIWHWGDKNVVKGEDTYVVRVSMLYLAALQLKEDMVKMAPVGQNLDILLSILATMGGPTPPPPTTDLDEPTSTVQASRKVAKKRPRSRKR